MEYNTQKIRLRFFRKLYIRQKVWEKHLMLDEERKSDGQVEGTCQIRRRSRWGASSNHSGEKCGEKSRFFFKMLIISGSIPEMSLSLTEKPWRHSRFIAKGRHKR